MRQVRVGGNVRAQGRGGENARGDRLNLERKGASNANSIYAKSMAATKPVFKGGVQADEGTNWGPADCRIYGVKAYKPEGRNPSEPTVHIDFDTHLSFKVSTPILFQLLVMFNLQIVFGYVDT